jgi:hypothetical protein
MIPHKKRALMGIINKIIILGLLYLCAGCSKYKPRHISCQNKIHNSFFEQKKNADISIETPSFEKQKKFLSKYKALHIKIKNKTDQSIYLYGQDISIPIESVFNIYKKEPIFYVRNFIPANMFLILGFFFWWEICVPLAACASLCAIQIGAKERQEARQELLALSLGPTDKIEISKYSSKDFLIFIKENNYSSEFNIKLTDINNKTVEEFNVEIVSRVKCEYKAY